MTRTVTDTPKLDPAEIWLEPECCADPRTGRTWAEDNPFPDCDEGRQPTRYVRADLAASTAPDLEGLRERVAQIVSGLVNGFTDFTPAEREAFAKRKTDAILSLIFTPDPKS